MMSLKTRHAPFLQRTVLVVAALAFFHLTTAAAAPSDETRWVKAFHAEARFVAGNTRKGDGGKRLLAGIQLRLDKGWKTYWRNPGDAGLPPMFDWSASRNLKSAHVLFPAPERFADPYGSSIGYKDEVVFPVLVEAVDAGKPVTLNLQFDYAVCDDICAPAEAKLTMTIGGQDASSSRHQALLQRYMDQVPSRAPAGAKFPSLQNVEFDLASSKPHIAIDALYPGGTEGADLFVEGPEEFYVPLAKKVKEEPGGRIRFSVDLSKGDDPARLKGETLTFTIVSRAGHAETTRQVD